MRFRVSRAPFPTGTGKEAALLGANLSTETPLHNDGPGLARGWLGWRFWACMAVHAPRGEPSSRGSAPRPAQLWLLCHHHPHRQFHFSALAECLPSLLSRGSGTDAVGM